MPSPTHSQSSTGSVAGRTLPWFHGDLCRTGLVPPGSSWGLCRWFPQNGIPVPITAAGVCSHTASCRENGACVALWSGKNRDDKKDKDEGKNEKKEEGKRGKRGNAKGGREKRLKMGWGGSGEEEGQIEEGEGKEQGQGKKRGKEEEKKGEEGGRGALLCLCQAVLLNVPSSAPI